MTQSDYERGFMAGQFDTEKKFATPKPTFTIDAVKDLVQIKMEMRALENAVNRNKQFPNQCAMMATVESQLARHLGERMINMADLADAHARRGEVA